jgi:cell division protein FtsL
VKKHFLIVGVILIVTAVFIVVYEDFRNRQIISERGDAIYHDPPLLDVNLSTWRENVTQGSTLKVNVTLISRADQELTIPIENLKLAGFNNTAWDNPIPQNKLFNYTFSNNELVLQPNESKSTVLTLEIAEDAPLVEYLFYIELGNSQITQLEAVSLTIGVTPKLK